MQNYEVSYRKIWEGNDAFLAHSFADAEQKFIAEYEGMEVEIYSIRRIENV